MSSYRLGFQAFITGISHWDNPYNENTNMFERWSAGWHDAWITSQIAKTVTF